MKGLFLSAIASFFGGIAVLLFQAYVQISGPTAKLQQVEITTAEQSIPLSFGDFRKIQSWYLDVPEYLRKLQEDKGLELHKFEIKNTGSADAQNIPLRIDSGTAPSDGSFLAAKISEPILDNDDAESLDLRPILSLNDRKNIEIEISKDKATAAYQIPLLKPHEKVVIFLVANDLSSPNVVVRGKDLNVKYGKSKIGEDGGSGTFYWVAAILIGIALLIGGMGLSELLHRDMFKKIGFDYDEMMNLYKQAEKDGG